MNRNKKAASLLPVFFLVIGVVCSANDTELSAFDYEKGILELPSVLKSYKKMEFTRGEALKDCDNLYKPIYVFTTDEMSPQQKEGFIKTCKRLANEIYDNDSL